MLKERVAVALSGGVDSAVSAYLLKKAGYDLVGVHMINWDPLEEGTSQCSRTVDEADAREVAKKLSIPFETVNFVKEYWNEVFTDMVENYRRGRTVVPDIACNRHIKFHHLHEFAIRQLGAKFVATGHYATIARGKYGIKLMTAVDRLKDQTYFLCTLSQDQLRQALFPLGSMAKPKVKQIAKEQGFDKISNKPESMGICFVGKRNNFDEFMDQYTEPREGEIVTLDGQKLATHSGVHHFTIGKRLHIHSSLSKQHSHLKFFVGSIDVERNAIIACAGTHNPFLFATEFSLQNLNLINGQIIDLDSPLYCRIQRTHEPIRCRLWWNESTQRYHVQGRLPFRAVASGQMCVFYRQRECLGGGEIGEVVQNLYNNLTHFKNSKKSTILDSNHLTKPLHPPTTYSNHGFCQKQIIKSI